VIILKIEIKEMSRTSENDIIEIEGKIIRALTPKEGEWGWSQFVVVKDNTDKMGAWLKLDGEDDKVLKGSSVKVKGKVSKKFKNSQGKMARSLNGCQFEVIGRVQAPAQSSAQSTGNGNGTKDNYWEKKFKYEVEKDPIVQIVIIRQCAIKAVTELAKVTPSKNFLIKVHTEKDFFEFAIKIEKHIFRNLVLKESILTFGGKITGVSKDGTPKVETKEEKIKKARETVGETEFKPASEKQKNVIFGYRDKDGWHKGIIESRYI
jgi:aspartyl/asparaginyl-tRNA synthetase